MNLDIDKMMQSLYHEMPNVDSELLYVSEVDKIMKVYLLMAGLGLLIVITILIYML